MINLILTVSTSSSPTPTDRRWRIRWPAGRSSSAAVTQGLGADLLMAAAAEESIEAVMGELADRNMVFITAGMGGGTGTGAAPVIAVAARARHPDRRRRHQAVRIRRPAADGAGRDRHFRDQSFVDTLIVIPNQNLFRLANERTFADAFHMADTVLHRVSPG